MYEAIWNFLEMVEHGARLGAALPVTFGADREPLRDLLPSSCFSRRVENAKSASRLPDPLEAGHVALPALDVIISRAGDLLRLHLAECGSDAPGRR